jgi:CDP-diacylglycerol--glycerol-3-phosphate 3-phosphatidyltransferase
MARVTTLANHLTILRLLTIPFLLVLLSFPQKLTSFLATIVFFLASMTDFLDGFFARRKKEITSFGKLLDPLADKLLVAAALIMLISLERAPAWMVFLIIAREITITGLRNILALKGIIVDASHWGKGKLVSQTIAILCLMLHYPYFGINFHLLGMIFLWFALFVTFWSGIKYFMKYIKYIEA